MAIGVLSDNIEMVIETGHLEDLGLGHAHFLRQCGQMGRGQLAEVVLDGVQMLDQQVSAARGIAQQLAHLGQCRRVHLPALGLAAFALAASALHHNRNHNLVHGESCGLLSCSSAMLPADLDHTPGVAWRRQVSPDGGRRTHKGPRAGGPFPCVLACPGQVRSSGTGR
ncbi:hypothetical protein D3C86_1178310 [compost metagenome]